MKSPVTRMTKKDRVTNTKMNLNPGEIALFFNEWLLSQLSSISLFSIRLDLTMLTSKCTRAWTESTQKNETMCQPSSLSIVLKTMKPSICCLSRDFSVCSAKFLNFKAEATVQKGETLSFFCFDRFLGATQALRSCCFNKLQIFVDLI